MDRLVNIRMTADLSQIIQQFTQLNNTISTVTSSMGGLTGQNMSLGGYGPGSGVMPGGGGAYGPGMGSGGPAPGVGMSNPRMSNRAQPGQPSGRAIGRGDGRDVTSMMFGLSQIGFALEDYQYAGWRGVMNNVPWIANAMTSMIAPSLGPYALLATAIGVPAMNALYNNMAPEQQMNMMQNLFGGAGGSQEQINQMRMDQMRSSLEKYGTLDYRRSNLEFQLARDQLYETDRTAAIGYAANFGKSSAETRSENMATYSEFENMQRQSRTFVQAENRARGRTNAFSRGDYDTAENRAEQEVENMDYGTYVISKIGSFYRNRFENAKYQLGIEGAETDEKKRRINAQLIKLQEKKKQAYDDWIAEFGKLERGEQPDWNKMEQCAKTIGDQDLIQQTRKLKEEYRTARQTILQDKSQEQTAAEDDMLFYQQQEEDDKVTSRKTRAAAGRYSGQIEAIVAGSTSGEQARGRVKEFLQKQNVDSEAIQKIVSSDFEKGVQDAIDNRPRSDEQLWEQYGDQWIATVKSDILQAQNASWVGGRFRQQVFNSYIYRIKTKIRDDLALAGVSRKKLNDYGNMIFNAAYKQAEESYKDSREIASNALQADGMKPTGSQIHNAAMQNLVGEMSDDLTAVYGNASANTFMMNRVYQQQLRRRQILLNRFQR